MPPEEPKSTSPLDATPSRPSSSSPSPSFSSTPTEKLGDPGELEATAKKEKKREAGEEVGRGACVGRYLVVDLVGEGGMGSVWRAFDPELGRQVALKLLKPGDDEGLEEARARLQREGQAMARLSHPNVVPVFDTGAHGRRLFVAMELVEGSNLARWLEAPRTRREVLEAFAAAGEGLRAAHAAGLVHRDFKPENVLVGDDGRVRVTDFGLAHLDGLQGPPSEPSVRAAPQATLAGTISGTPAYMAPEQMLGEATDPRTDQFSFCVALYEALAGHPPFGRGGFHAMREAVLLGRPAAPQRPLPARLHRALLRGLSRRKEDRFASMDELLAVLRRDPVRTAKRAALPAASLLVLAAVALAAAVQSREERLFCGRQTAAARERTWGGARRAQVERRLAGAASLPAADVLAELDADLARWAELREAACRAAREGDASAKLSRDCLDRYLVEADVLVAALEKPEELGDAGAGFVDDGLGSPDRCRGLASKPVVAAAADPDLLRQLSQVRLEVELGQVEKALPRAQALARQARAEGDLVASSGLEEVAGRALLLSGGPADEALAAFRRGVRDADAGGDDEDGFRARLAMAEALNLRLARPAEALEAAHDTEAWLRRLGDPPGLRQRLLRTRAQILTNLKRHEEAIAAFRESARLAREVPASVSDQASAAADLAAALGRTGRYAEAAAELERALDLYGKARFKSADEQVVALMNLGVIRVSQGRPAEGLALMDRARGAAQALGALDTYRTWVDSHRGRALLEAGRLDEAEEALAACAAAPVEIDPGSICAAKAALSRVLAARGKAALALPEAEQALGLDPGTNESLTAYLRFSLAQALRAAGREPARAAEAARKALEGYAGPEDGYRRRQIEEWLAAPAPSRTP